MMRSTIFWGGLLVLFGLLLLLGNAGLFGDFNVWDLIWPLFLIFLGIWILFSYFSRSSQGFEELNIPSGSAEAANIRFDHGAGRLSVMAGLDQNDLVSGEFSGGVEYSADLEKMQGEIRLKIPRNRFPFFWIPGATQGISWKVYLKPNFVFSLNFNTGAGEANIDLSDLLVDRVVLKTGVSSTKIVMPENAGYTKVRIESGLASVDVHIPGSVAARIRTSVGLGSVIVDRDRFPKKGSVFLSPDYESANNKVDIDISSGLGSINIQ